VAKFGTGRCDTLTYRYETNTFHKFEAGASQEDRPMAACFRYIVDDVDAAIDFYTTQLGFTLEMHPSPPFAEISRGDMHLYLSQPSAHGGGAPMPSGEQPRPGGWNRIHLVVDDLDATVARLKAAGGRFRNEAVQGGGGKQMLLEDPSGNLVELFEPNSPAYRAPGSGSRAARK
jgi:predicted enzyme related to lactoylglutathione lyase